MKKTIIFLAALAFIACGNGHKVSNNPAKMIAEDSTFVLNLANETDSMNYAIGLLNGIQLKHYYLSDDDSDTTIVEFLETLEKAYNDEFASETQAQKIGSQLGIFVQDIEREGIANHSDWIVNEPIFFQGIINAFFEDTTVMNPHAAETFFMAAYQSAPASVATELQPVIDACPTAPAAIALASFNDSINYAFGLLNGGQIRSKIVLEDDFDAAVQEFVTALEAARHTSVRNPQLVEIAKNIGATIREQEPTGLINIDGLQTDLALIERGFIHGFKNNTAVFNMNSADAYISSVMRAVQEREREAKAAEQAAIAKQHQAEGEAFLAENAKREGVQTTESGLQYEVLVMGDGPKPTAEQTVKVHYEGTLIDGTVFDSSYERGEPISFPLNRVIAGWTEGLQLMPVGSKYKLFIPYTLGYGETGAGESIPPCATLIFTVELLSIEQ